MNELLQALSRFFSSWKFWIVIAPWEIGVRVRLGRIARSLTPGPHLRIPLLDEITLVNTRLRISTAPAVTIPSANGKVRMITPSVGYRIWDPERAMLRYSHPGIAVLSLAQAEITGGATADAAHKALSELFAASGIAIEFVRYVEDVEVRAYRLLNGTWVLHQEEHQAGKQERY